MFRKYVLLQIKNCVVTLQHLFFCITTPNLCCSRPILQQHDQQHHLSHVLLSILATHICRYSNIYTCCYNSVLLQCKHLTGEEVQAQMNALVLDTKNFGKTHNWTHVSCFWQLPYFNKLLLRHNNFQYEIYPLLKHLLHVLSYFMQRAINQAQGVQKIP